MCSEYKISNLERLPTENPASHPPPSTPAPQMTSAPPRASLASSDRTPGQCGPLHPLGSLSKVSAALVGVLHLPYGHIRRYGFRSLALYGTQSPTTSCLQPFRGSLSAPALVGILRGSRLGSKPLKPVAEFKTLLLKQWPAQLFNCDLWGVSPQECSVREEAGSPSSGIYFRGITSILHTGHEAGDSPTLLAWEVAAEEAERGVSSMKIEPGTCLPALRLLWAALEERCRWKGLGVAASAGREGLLCGCAEISGTSAGVGGVSEDSRSIVPAENNGHHFFSGPQPLRICILQNLAY